MENNNQLMKSINNQGGGAGNCHQVVIGVEKERGETGGHRSRKGKRRGEGRGVSPYNCGKDDGRYYVDVEMNGAMLRNMEKGKMGW